MAYMTISTWENFSSRRVSSVEWLFLVCSLVSAVALCHWREVLDYKETTGLQLELVSRECMFSSMFSDWITTSTGRYYWMIVLNCSRKVSLGRCTIVRLSVAHSIRTAPTSDPACRMAMRYFSSTNRLLPSLSWRVSFMVPLVTTSTISL